jgi:hypothetical protein
MDHSDALWQWNPHSAVIVNQKWLKDSLQSVELKLPPLWTAQITQEYFLNTLDVLKLFELLIACPPESESWMEPIPLTSASEVFVFRANDRQTTEQGNFLGGVEGDLGARECGNLGCR